MPSAIEKLRSKNKFADSSLQPASPQSAASHREMLAAVATDDQPSLSIPLNVPPVPCLICECPAVWFSVYDDLQVDPQSGAEVVPQARCCVCDPPPGRSVVASRWLLVLVYGDFDDLNRTRLVDPVWEWEEFPWVDYRRLDFRPRPSFTTLDDLQGEGDGESGSSTDGPLASDETQAAKSDDDEARLAYDRRKKTAAETFPGTLIGFRAPVEFTTPWGTLLVTEAGAAERSRWNDLVRLSARFGFDEAWRMLGERTERIFARSK